MNHGTRSCYVYWKCRCDECRAADSAYGRALYWGHAKKYRHPGDRSLPAEGTRRRLRALIALGWPSDALAGRLGLETRQGVLLMGVSGRVSVRNARRVDALYAELSMTPGPSRKSREVAARQGWPPPLAWDDIDDPDEVPLIGSRKPGAVDDLAVEFFLDGRIEFSRLTRGEGTEAVRRLAARGMTRGQLAELTGLSDDAADKRLCRVRAA